jgi:hypothetical protein
LSVKKNLDADNGKLMVEIIAQYLQRRCLFSIPGKGQQ